MAGLKGKSGPPGNMNAFKHGLAAIQKRREETITTDHEESVRQQILEGLIADKGGDQQVSTATRILAEVIASDAAWLMVFNGLAHLTAEGQQFSRFVKFYHRRFGRDLDSQNSWITKRRLEAQFDPNARIGPHLVGGLSQY